MVWSVNSNVTSLFANRSLNRAQQGANKALERLSTGLRVNSAADDAAGLAISTKLSARIRGLEQAQRNVGDAVSLAETADGAMDQISDILIRMRELAVQSGNGSLSAADRVALDTEYDGLVSELDAIAQNTSFNGRDLLDGDTSAGVTFQIGQGSGATNQVTLSIGSLRQSVIGSAALSAQTISTTGGASTAIGVIDSAINKLVAQRGKVGAVINRLDYSNNSLGAEIETLSAANSRVIDADFARETANLTRFQILTQSGLNVIAQSNYQSQLLSRLF
jgi:flagellin